MRRYKMRAKIRSQNLKDHFKYLRTNGREVIKGLIQNYDGTVRSGFVRLRIGTSRGAFVNTVKNFQSPQKAGNLLTS
jgi:hypothetical protein